MLQAWKSFYARSDPAKAYSLLSPALILVTLAMLVPLVLMLSFSFFTQVSFTEIETDKGHDSFLLEEPELDFVIKGFLESNFETNE